MLKPRPSTYEIHRVHSRELRAQRGFSLMEVLVSIVVLSFGLLGMVGMQAAALQSNREAKLQSLAASYAKELAEMMRGNSEVGILNNTSNLYLGDFTRPVSGTARVVATENCYLKTGGIGLCESNSTTPRLGALSCTGTFSSMPAPCRVARWEINDWLDRVERDLPGSRVVVCFDTRPYETDGRPRWACTNTGTDAVVKIGWTRRSTDRSQKGDEAFERATIPSMVVAVTPGRANP